MWKSERRPRAAAEITASTDKRKLVGGGVNSCGRKKVWNDDAVCSVAAAAAAPTPPGRKRNHRLISFAAEARVFESGNLDLDLHARFVAIIRWEKKETA